jgi:signal transduction histidine kinase
MRSLFAKILLWFWCALAITVVGSAFISALNVNQNDSDQRAPVARLVTFQLEEARSAYETGGRPGLQAFLDTLHRVYDAQGVLTDEKGRDLLSNADRSDLVRHARRRALDQIFRTGDATVARASDDGRYWFFFIVPRAPVGSWFLQPEHIFVIAAAVLLCYWLAYYLTSPVRKLEKAVERFGRGDLSARVSSNRRDELGQLACTFDRMASRIETLMAAERRLLLDISHELRSPLARLGVAVELARSGDDPESAFTRIQKESDRLNALVGQLLQVTRAEGDPSSLRHDPVRLDELVEQLVDDSTIEAAARGCEVRYGKREPVTVAGDPELLRRAPRRSRCGWRASTAGRCWTCAITVPACPKRRCRGFSTRSTGWNPAATAPAAAPGWACRSRAAPSSCTTAASAQKTRSQAWKWRWIRQFLPETCIEWISSGGLCPVAASNVRFTTSPFSWLHRLRPLPASASLHPIATFWCWKILPYPSALRRDRKWKLPRRRPIGSRSRPGNATSCGNSSRARSRSPVRFPRS